MSEQTHWLTPAEQDAWRAFLRVHLKLAARMSRELQVRSKLSGADYEVLVALTDTPDGRLRFQCLTRAVDWEQSRLSHQISRMTKRGLVTRMECTDDGRGGFVAITPAGRAVIEAAAPHHVAMIRRLVIDPLGPDDLQTLARISNRMLDHIDNPAA